VALPARDPVVVVEDDDDLLVRGVELVEDLRHQGVESQPANRAESRHHGACEVRNDASDRCDEA
jgi:hypothetical protein